MDNKRNSSEDGIFVVVNSGRKRRPNEPPRYDVYDNGCQKQRLNPATGRGEQCLPARQCSADRSNMMMRKQMSYVAGTGMNPVMPKLEASDDQTEIYRANPAELGQNYLDDVPLATSSMCSTEEIPMCMMPDGTYRPMLVDPDSFDDILSLREALNTANMTIRELMNREKKLRRDKISMRHHLDNEMQRASDLERFLREQNMRVNKIIAENVRWTARYSRLRLNFGEEDLKAALGELAPEYR